MRHFLWGFLKQFIFTFEFVGMSMAQFAIVHHFHFDFLESTLLGGGCGMLLSSYLTKRDKPFIINIALPNVPQKD